MGSITNKSATWEFLNSLWILFSFAFFSLIGFYYIGIRVKKKMWMFFGFIYFFLLLIISSAPELKNEGAVAALYYISGIVLSFYLRKDYLIRLETIKGNNVSYIENETLQKQFKKKSSPKKRKISEKENKNLRKQIAKEFDEKGISAKRSNPEQIEELEDAVAKKPLQLRTP